MRQGLEGDPYAWTGVIPSNWSHARLGSLFRERNVSTNAEESPPLSVTKSGVVDQEEHVAKSQLGAPKKLARLGDLVINSRSDRKGSAGLAPRDGSVSLINTVLEPLGIHPRFASFLLRSSAFQEEFFRHGSGIVADLWTTRYSAMKSIQLPVPPKSEQQAIADYLDHETAEIDAFIADLDFLEEFLSERASAIIDETFLEMRAEWAPLKRFGITKSIGYSANGSAFSAGAGEVGVLKTGAVSKGHFVPSENKLVDDPSEVEKLQAPVKSRMLVVNRANTPALVGSAGYVDNDYPGLFLSDLLWAVSFEQIDPEFVYFFSRSRMYRESMSLMSVGASSTMKKIRFDDLATLEVPVVSAEAQKAVVAKLKHEEQEWREIHQTITSAKRLATERRGALITAAVTGQVDVTQRHKPVAEVLEDEVREMV